MLLSVCLDPGRPMPDLLHLARAADDAGLVRIYLPDHFMPYHATDAVGGPVHECWTTLTGCATVTSRIGLGTLVLGNTYRHPAVLANMAATLDQLSGGRLLLGLGAGWQRNEHAAYGIPLPATGVRLDRLEEAVQVIALLLRGEVCSFEGTHYRLDNARCEPPPVQRRLPLLVAGGGERRTIPIAGRHADAWHAWATPEDFRHKCRLLDAACVAAGRAPADVSRLTGQVLHVSTGRFAGPGDDDEDDIIGSVAFVCERLDGFRDAGVDEFVVRDHAQISVADAVESLGLLASEVAPALS